MLAYCGKYKGMAPTVENVSPSQLMSTYFGCLVFSIEENCKRKEKCLPTLGIFSGNKEEGGGEEKREKGTNG